MLSLKSKVGKSSGLHRDEISPARIADFCKSIGAKVRDSAPPTFLTVFRGGEFQLFQQLGLELSKVLHAEQEYQYDRPVLAGDFISFETKLIHVLEKFGATNQLQFLTFETTFEVERQKERLPVGKSKTTVILRDTVSNAN